VSGIDGGPLLHDRNDLLWRHVSECNVVGCRECENIACSGHGFSLQEKTWKGGRIIRRYIFLLGLLKWAEVIYEDKVVFIFGVLNPAHALVTGAKVTFGIIDW